MPRIEEFQQLGQVSIGDECDIAVAGLCHIGILQLLTPLLVLFEY
jgi:hypothetical protein